MTESHFGWCAAPRCLGMKGLMLISVAVLLHGAPRDQLLRFLTDQKRSHPGSLSVLFIEYTKCLASEVNKSGR